MNNEIDGFKKVIDEMLALKTKKAADYGNTWRAFGMYGLYHQLGRKFGRIWLNKDKKQGELNNEMMRDSLMDLAVYSLMSIQLIDEGGADKDDMITKALKGEI